MLSLPRVFLKSNPLWAVNFTNNVPMSGWTWHKLWNLVTITFKNKYFNHFEDCSGIYLKVYIPLWFAKTLGSIVFRLLAKAFVRLPHSLHDLIINPACRTASNKFPKNNLSPKFHENLLEKSPSILYRGRHYALAPLENHVWVYAPSIFARKFKLKLLSILNLAKKISWQKESVGWGIK